jgi:death-on-curing protein
MHDDQIRKHGGTPELRDEPSLDSALAAPEFRWQYNPEVSLCELAATYGFHISENQPFLDGNKRTARMAIIVFLLSNGLKVTASEEDVFEKILDVANRRMNKQQLAGWLSSVTEKIFS